MIKSTTSLSQPNLQKPNSGRICRKVIDSPYSKNFKCTIKHEEKNLIKQRQSVTKIKRSELEDKYLLLCDENYSIKRDNIDKDEKIKQISTKLIRTSSGIDMKLQKSNRSLLDEDNFQLKIDELEEENDRLRAQIKNSETSLFLKKLNVNENENENEEDIEVTDVLESLDNEVRNGRATAGGIDNNLQNELNKLKTEINKLTDELIQERARTNDMKAQTCILEEKLSVVSIKKKITENVEIIMLRRKLHEKERELLIMKDKVKSQECVSKKTTNGCCNTEMCGQLSKLEYQLLKEKEKNERLEKSSNELIECKKRLCELKSELCEAQTAKQILEDQTKNYEELVCESRTQRDRICELETNISWLSKNYDNLTSIKCTLEHKNDELLNKIKALQCENDKLLNSLEGLRAKSEYIQIKNNELESYISDLECEKNDICGKKTILEDAIKQLEQKLKMCCKQIRTNKIDDCQQASPRITIEMDNHDESNQNINVIIENENTDDEYKNYLTVGMQTDSSLLIGGCGGGGGGGSHGSHCCNETKYDDLGKRLEILEKNAISEYLKEKSKSEPAKKVTSCVLIKRQKQVTPPNKSESDIKLSDFVKDLTIDDKLKIEKNINVLLRNELDSMYKRSRVCIHDNNKTKNKSFCDRDSCDNHTCGNDDIYKTDARVRSCMNIKENHSVCNTNVNCIINDDCKNSNSKNSGSTCSKNSGSTCSKNSASICNNNNNNNITTIYDNDILKYDYGCGVLEIHVDNLKLSHEGIQLLSCKHGNIMNVMLNWLFYNNEDLSTTENKPGPVYVFDTTYLYKVKINNEFFEYLLYNNMCINLMTCDDKYLGKCIVKFDDILKYPQNKIHCILKISSDDENNSTSNNDNSCNSNNSNNTDTENQCCVKQDNCLRVTKKYNFFTRSRQYGILSLWLRLTCDIKLIEDFLTEKGKLNDCYYKNDTDAQTLSTNTTCDLGESNSSNNDNYDLNNDSDIEFHFPKYDVNKTSSKQRTPSSNITHSEHDEKLIKSEINEIHEINETNETKAQNYSDPEKEEQTNFWSNIIPKDATNNSNYYVLKNELKVDNVAIDPNYVQLLDIDSYKVADLIKNSSLDKSKQNIINEINKKSIASELKTINEIYSQETIVITEQNPSETIKKISDIDKILLDTHNFAWASKDDTLVITIEIASIRLDPNYELFSYPFVKQLYVEYSFLGYYGHLLETPKSLPMPKAYDLLIFNFRKIFHLNYHRHKKQLNLLLTLLKNDESIKFIIVSEPTDDDLKNFPGLECLEIGFSLLKLNQIIKATVKDSVSVELPVLAVKYPHTNIGILRVIVDGISSMRDFLGAN